MNPSHWSTQEKGVRYEEQRVGLKVQAGNEVKPRRLSTPSVKMAGRLISYTNLLYEVMTRWKPTIQRVVNVMIVIGEEKQIELQHFYWIFNSIITKHPMTDSCWWCKYKNTNKVSNNITVALKDGDTSSIAPQCCLKPVLNIQARLQEEPKD